MKVNKCKLILVKEKELDYEKLNSPDTIYDFLVNKMELHKEPEEVVVMLALDNKNRLMSCCEISHGTLNSAMVSPRDVYKRALVANAKSIIIAHNHPTGSVTPSLEDKIITSSLKEAGKVLDVKLLDHIIVGDKRYYSFYEENPDLIFSEECNKFYNQYEIEEKKINNTERSL